MPPYLHPGHAQVIQPALPHQHGETALINYFYRIHCDEPAKLLVKYLGVN